MENIAVRVTSPYADRNNRDTINQIKKISTGKKQNLDLTDMQYKNKLEDRLIIYNRDIEYAKHHKNNYEGSKSRCLLAKNMIYNIQKIINNAYTSNDQLSKYQYNDESLKSEDPRIKQIKNSISSLTNSLKSDNIIDKGSRFQWGTDTKSNDKYRININPIAADYLFSNGLLIQCLDRKENNQYCSAYDLAQLISNANQNKTEENLKPIASIIASIFKKKDKITDNQEIFEKAFPLPSEITEKIINMLFDMNSKDYKSTEEKAEAILNDNNQDINLLTEKLLSALRDDKKISIESAINKDNINKDNINDNNSINNDNNSTKTPNSLSDNDNQDKNKILYDIFSFLGSKIEETHTQEISILASNAMNVITIAEHDIIYLENSSSQLEEYSKESYDNDNNLLNSIDEIDLMKEINKLASCLTSAQMMNMVISSGAKLQQLIVQGAQQQLSI